MFTYHDYTPKIANQTKIGANQFLRNVIEAIDNEARPNTPKKSGKLRHIKKTIQALHAEIKWDKPYAQYQERGSRADGSHVVRNYTTPGTGRAFAKNAVQAVVAKTDGIVRATGGLPK